MKKQFQARLELSQNNLGWTIVPIPFDVKATWKQRNRMRVRGTINGCVFRSSLFPAKPNGHHLLINKQMQKRANATLGSIVTVEIELDLEERTEAQLPQELHNLFKQEKELHRFYDALSSSMKHEIERHLHEPKTAELRNKRAKQLAERMLLSLEGEKELPPLLQIVFRRYPDAETGWQQMTPIQRRGHLMGIFSYKSPEAREKRAAKAASEASKHAQKKKAVSS